MVSSKINSVENIKKCINQNNSFVLQGGAGSGKTETLKVAIEHTLLNANNKVLCITHTNAAVDEIKRRIDGDYDVSTIHSFLHNLIKNFKVNIKDELIRINKLGKMPRIDSLKLNKEEKIYRQERHKLYKGLYERYNMRLYKRRGESLGKVIDKRAYDTEYVVGNELSYTNSDVMLNEKIDQMNKIVEEEIKNISYYNVHYNNRKFDNIDSLAYGHDSLLIIATDLMNRFSKLQKILQDKYNYIFIDEYQDTNPDVLQGLINTFISKNNTIGLFGDSMQSIYDDGIGDVKSYIENGQLIEVQKEDNFRSSYQVVELINRIRTDGLEQEVALKEKEKRSDRQGSVKFYYVIKEFEKDQKEEKSDFMNRLKQHILKEKDDFVQLELSNSAIAMEMGYTELYNRYKSASDINEEILGDLTQLHLRELYEIIKAFKNGNHNIVIEKLKYNGWILRKMKDKRNIVQALKSFSEDDLSVKTALKKAFEDKILKESDSYKSLISKIKLFYKDLNEREKYFEFKGLYESGKTSFSKIQKESDIIISQEHFKEYIRLYNRERKYNYLNSEEFKLAEAFNFLEYQLENNNISTMHRTKGEGIENVAIILDNYQWHKYNFDKMFDENYFRESVKSRTQKLFYVACSRAKRNLILIKVMKNEQELEMFKNKLSSKIFDEVELDSLLKQSGIPESV